MVAAGAAGSCLRTYFSVTLRSLFVSVWAVSKRELVARASKRSAPDKMRSSICFGVRLKMRFALEKPPSCYHDLRFQIVWFCPFGRMGLMKETAIGCREVLSEA